MAATKTKFMTADELLKMPDDGYRYELVRGVLKKMAPVGHTGGSYEANAIGELRAFVKANRLGTTYSSSTGFLLERDPDHVRMPDAAFVRRERVEEVAEVQGFFPGAPDFVAEVISPSDRLANVYNKVEEWLNAGARMVIVINPRNRTVGVHTPDAIITLNEGDTLEGGDAVPGWRLPVVDLFE